MTHIPTTEADDTLGMIRDQASRLLSKSAAPEHLNALLDRATGFDKALWVSAAEQGWPTVSVPEEAGGLGLGWRGLCTLTEEAGNKSVSLPLTPNAVAVAALLASGDAELIDRYAQPLVTGDSIACLAFAEPGESGLRIRPELRFANGKLDGSKAPAAFAAVADVALVQAVDPAGETVLLLVALDQREVTRRITATLDSTRATAALDFNAAPAHPLSGTGAMAFDEATALAAIATAFEQIGGASGCLEMARDYALERRAFGQPIGRFQAIKHKIADMYWRLEIARGCALDALEAYEQQNPLWLGMAAAARIAAIEAFDFAARENIQTHGGIGVTWEAMPHHYYRRARCLALELGSAPYWREQLLTSVGYDDVAEK
ncbi:MAG: acyl-CoA dehydrogenase family protein [Pseudomonadota bacterium]|nr:acyl-CoA dehydrogenase family protein [Pseudomonadota bacterium]